MLRCRFGAAALLASTATLLGLTTLVSFKTEGKYAGYYVWQASQVCLATSATCCWFRQRRRTIQRQPQGECAVRLAALPVSDAQAVYTDSWTSMGFEAEEKVRAAAFQPYQVNPELMSLAAPDAVFMHCLPAHRGLEVTSEVLDGPQSVVLDQSENRMYVQKAILHTLF